MMVSLLISGPKQPGNDIDVYLAPLIDELKLLWENGVQAFDGHLKEEFTLRAVLLWTINDFPAYGNLSGYSVKGFKGCPICADDTKGEYLKYGQKVVYMNHRRFLPLNHRFRRCQAAFNGKKEFRTVKKPLSGVETFNMLSKMKLRPLGKIVKKPKSDTSVKRKRGEKVVYDEGSWKKKSIFFELEYWKHLLVRHNLDVMHIEKNVCDSVISTLLNIPGKTKDGISSRRDLVHMGIRTELAPKENGNRTYLPPCSFTLTREEKSYISTTMVRRESFDKERCYLYTSLFIKNTEYRSYQAFRLHH